jgi:ABC-2 type transport system permease protein
LITLIFGCFYGIVLFLFKKPLLGQTVYFSAFMVLMSLMLITDFTNVLIDVRDQYIIAPRPVNDRTVAMARILHISVYVLKLALIQGFPGIIMVGFVDGIAAVPLFFVQIVLATLLSIFIVNMVYLLLMRSVSAQKFKDIISYFQIAFSILIFGGYRLLPRLIDMSALSNYDLLSHKWAYFVPSVWIAAINEALIHAGRSGLVATGVAVLGFGLPFLSIWFVAKVLAPGFNKSLSMIAMADGPVTGVENKKVKKMGFIDKIARLVAPDPIENAGFKITWKLAARTREFKTKVYPQFAFIPVYFAYFILSGTGDAGEQYEKIQHGRSYIFLFYFSSIILSAILQQISQSEKYKASWVYYALPIDKPGKILAGMYKAITMLYILPFFIVLGIASVFIWGVPVINDVILAFLLLQVYGIIIALFLVKGLPFSRPVLVKQSGGKVITTFLLMGVTFLFGWGHYVLAQWETVIWICIIPAILLYWIMIRYYSKQTWESVELSEID